jgi:hypothetical protein
MANTTHTPSRVDAQDQFEAPDITIEEGLRRGRVARAEAFADAGKHIASVVNRMFERQNAAIRMLQRNKGRNPCRERPSAYPSAA